MSLNVLYCEGNHKSFDIRLLQQLVPGICLIKPIGSKYGLEDKIISDRALNPKLAGLRDRDFDCRDISIANEPRKWFDQNVQIGWCWERKEIENYLIDPEVVGRDLGRKAPPMDEYKLALQRSAQTISAYTAARTALSCYRFTNAWGESVDKKTHSFPQGGRLGQDQCRIKIKEIVRENKGDRIVEEQNVVDKFENLLPLYRRGGSRFQNCLTYFAGKDLLYVMKNDLEKFGFDPKDPIPTFLERVLQGIERSEDVWTWMPEWQKLRESITNFDN